MARRLCGGLLVVLLGGGVGWLLWGRLSRGVEYRNDVAVVRHAEGALDDGLPVVALQLLAEAGEPGRRRLGELLVASHTSTRWPDLVQAMESADPPVREAVADVLERSPEERLCAAEALAALGEPRGVQTLGLALMQPPEGAHDPAELGQLGAPGAQALLNVARGAPQAAAERAVRLLGGCASPSARRALVEMVLDGHCPRRAQALQVVSWHDPQALQSRLPTLLSDPDPAFRAEAAYQYGAAMGAEALPALWPALHDRDASVRGAVVEAAALIDGPEADAVLIRALQDPETAVARKAVCSLGWRRCRSAEGELVRLYPRSPSDLRRDIATALAWMGSPLGPEYRRRWEQETGRPLVLSSEWDG